MSGKPLYSGICWYDGERLELEQSDGTRVDISRFVDLVERPLAGQWAKRYPEGDYYVEMPENNGPDGSANPRPASVTK